MKYRMHAHRAVRWLALSVCAFFAVHGVRNGLRIEGSDFTIYYRAGAAVLVGGDPTAVDQYIYLPVFALALAPLALLPYAWALVLWQIASLWALAWITTRCARLCPSGERAGWITWLPLVACLRLVDSTLANGQANLLVLALIMAAIESATSRRDTRAGAWLGAAAAAKILPAGLLLVFGLRRRWRIVCTTLALLVAGLLLPALTMGWSANGAALEHWWRAQPLPYLQGGRALLAEREYLPGQSLTATAYRLLTATPSTSQPGSSATAELVDLDPDTVHWIVRTIGVLCVGFLIASLVISRRRNSPSAELREIALTMCFVLLLGPLVHKAHMVWLILPYALLFAGAPPGMGTAARRARWGFVVLSAVLIGLTSPALIGRFLSTQVLQYNTVFFGLVCVTCALAIDVWSRNARELGGPTGVRAA